jgi:hypothetical protein
MTPPTDILASFGWVLWAAIGVVVLAVIWTVVQFVFKLTTKIFTLGCLGILLLGLLFAAASYFRGA